MGFKNLDDIFHAYQKRYRFSVDTRKMGSGDIFVALSGSRVDGHQFIKEAIKKKASCAIVRDSFTESYGTFPLVKVPDPLFSLQSLAEKAVVSASNRKIIAVTGSVGKTTTKEFIHTLLSEKYQVAVTPGNSNTQISLPLTILNDADGSEDFLVLEMGMSEVGNIRRLTEIAPPDISLVTTVSYVHAENFSGLDKITSAKGEIFSHNRTTKGIFPLDIKYPELLKNVGSCQKISFSTKEPLADYFLRKEGASFVVHANKEEIAFPPFHLPGIHNFHNLLSAIATAWECGLDWEEIRRGVRKLTLPAKRFEERIVQGIHFIFDAYNASPIATKAALESLPEPKKGGRKIAILGDMRELGQFSKPLHEEVGIFALSKVEHMFCLGLETLPIANVWENEQRPVFWTDNKQAIAKQIASFVQAGDVVLIKGSHSLGMETILDHFYGEKS